MQHQPVNRDMVKQRFRNLLAFVIVMLFLVALMATILCGFLRILVLLIQDSISFGLVSILGLAPVFISMMAHKYQLIGGIRLIQISGGIITGITMLVC
ncbi:MAG: hypothetical protein CMI08_05660 [Oceanospirillaceae bacterium]|nr:hypothetical protein [Oceanospirillaceae bacterium]MAX98684.1 hypothetical protein [Oceanospirillaceae bacterium]MBS52356.1 hypothetical protein [Oceanospirillaceae bacterium]